MYKTAILITAFGTSETSSLTDTIDMLTKQLRCEYPDTEIRPAISSRVISKLLRTSDISFPSPLEAADSLFTDGFTDIVCLSTHIMEGYSYCRLADELKSHPNGSHIRLTAPLLSDSSDIMSLRDILTSYMNDENAEYIFMAHGTSHEADKVCQQLAEAFSGISNAHIASLEGGLTLESVIPSLHKQEVILHPLTLFSGIHTRRDMCGIWKSLLENHGFTVRCHTNGLGTYKEIRDMFIKHLAALLDPHSNPN